jgi:uncharacterized membrane protein YebE (DUF533 family)
MDNKKLKGFVLKELQKDIPEEIAKDEKKAREFILSNINEPLVDKLVAEFCEKNPYDWEVLNMFTLSDEKTKEIQENIAAAIADGTVERLKYEQAVNEAGLAYHIAVWDEYMDELSDTVKRRDWK